jgi:hypothetical protein
VNDCHDWEPTDGGRRCKRCGMLDVEFPDGPKIGSARAADLVLRHEAAWLRVLCELGGGYGVSFEHGEDPERLADRALKLAAERWGSAQIVKP